MSDRPELLPALVDLTRCTRVEHLLDKVLHLAVRLTGARLGYAALGRADYPSWTTLHSTEPVDLEILRTRISHGILSAAADSGESLVTDDATGDIRFGGFDSVRFHGVQAVICTPLGGVDTPGVLYLEGRPEGGAFSDTEVSLVRDVARVAERLIRGLLLQVRAKSDDDPTARWRARLEATAVIGRSAALARVLEKLSVVARQKASVLLLGPSGCGKSDLARVLHDSGPRRRGPFIIVDCSRLNAERAEADLYGAAKGAYTGSDRRRLGHIAAADRGTLFLDEIGELAPDVQAQLLIFLQNRKVRSMGEEDERAVDVRIVAATSREPDVLMEALRYRVSTVRVRVPDLTERREDIPDLARSLVARIASHEDVQALPLADEAVDHLVYRNWPGNVRELGDALTLGLLWAHHDSSPVIERNHLIDRDAPPAEPRRTIPEVLDVAERQFRREHCLAVLARCGGNKTEAARRLGIARATLYVILKD